MKSSFLYNSAMLSKKQTRNVYLNTLFSASLPASACWVILLADRGFSLVEIGIFESIFHLTSFSFEIPSGMIADIFGKRRCMIASGIALTASAFFMLIGNTYFNIILAMIFSALGYSFASGAREALVYDTLKAENQTDNYLEFISNDSAIYRLFKAIATLMAGYTRKIGYISAYFIDIILSSISTFFAFRLKEIKKPLISKPLLSDIKNAFITTALNSFNFLLRNHQASFIIIINALCGVFAVLLSFFLQPYLTENGVDGIYLGIALFIISLGGAFGSKCAVLTSKISYPKVLILSVISITLCFLMIFTKLPLIMIICGFITSFFDDIIEIRSNTTLNEMIPEDERATLISVNSFTYSVFMIIMSPVIGWLFEIL